MGLRVNGGKDTVRGRFDDHENMLQVMMCIDVASQLFVIRYCVASTMLIKMKEKRWFKHVTNPFTSTDT